METYRSKGQGRTPGTIEWPRHVRGKPALVARRATITVLLATVLVVGLAPVRGAQPQAPAVTCPITYGIADDSKPNKLYLYFPSSDDSSFPEFGDTAGHTSPARSFNAGDLTSYTTPDLINAVFNVVKAQYCEFNVQVIQTTSAPPTTFARRNIVAIGTDAAVPGPIATPTPVNDCPYRTTATMPPNTVTFGLAQCVDTNDVTAVDYARIWAGGFQTQYGGSGTDDALTGSNSTLTRWANVIGSDVSHEAGHNYGLTHPDGEVLASGEDGNAANAIQHHLMARGSTYNGDDRAAFRHFSNREYSVLANNVGLAMQTMWNWDLVNPNAETGHGLRMDFLSTQLSIILSWSYAGSLTPWINPTVTGPLGTQVFKNTTYNQYRIEWSTGQAWSGGLSGQLPGGASFHVGTTFSSVNYAEPDAIIITNVDLLNNATSPQPLAQHPRLIAYDAGVADSANDSLDMRFFNTQRMALIIRDVVVRELPRVMSLNTMVPGGRMVDWRGHPFSPWPGSTRVALRESRLRPGQELKVRVARLSQRPHVFFVVNNQTCGNQDRLRGPDTLGCRPGSSTDLFPATTLFLTATVVDSSAKFWDRKTKKYVVGTLESHLFYQIAGRRRGRR